MTPQIAQRHQPRRISSDAVWPLRDAQGMTFADRARQRKEQQETKP